MLTLQPRRPMRPERRAAVAAVALAVLLAFAPILATAAVFDLGALTALLAKVRAGEATFV